MSYSSIPMMRAKKAEHHLAEDYLRIEDQFKKVVDYVYEHKDDLHVNMFDENFGVGDSYSSSDRERGSLYMLMLKNLNRKNDIYSTKEQNDKT
jgi:hypothetical protein